MKGERRERIFIAAGLAVLMVLGMMPRLTLASTDRFSVISFHPNPDTGRYFFVQGTESLPKWRYTIGTFFTYANWPLNIEQQTNYIRRGGVITATTDLNRGIENLFYEYFYGAFGITDHISLSFDFPLFWYYRYYSPVSVARTGETEAFKPGDLRFSAKFTIVDLKDSPVGFALIPAISAPTGEDDQFLGDDGVTGELRAVVEGKPHERVNLAFNVAYQTRSQKVVLNNIEFRDRMDFSLAAAVRVAKNVSIIAEAEAITPTTDFFATRASSPAEARAGVRWEPGHKGITVGLGGTVGIVHGAGAPRYSGFLNVAYSNARVPRKPAPETVSLPSLEEIEDCIVIPDGTGDHYRAVCSTYFGFNKSMVQHSDAIKAIVDFVKQSKGTVAIDVRGWTDPVGPSSYNKALSMRRAKSVARLIEQALGDARSRVEIRVLGIGEDTVSPHRVGRRAEVIVK